MFFTYILRCADNSYYTGHTDDLHRRIGQHQSGVVRGYTYERRPIELIWSDAFETRAEALEAEARIKGWSRAKKEALIAGNWAKLSKAALPPSEREQRASTSLGIVPRLRSGSREVSLESPAPAQGTPPIIVLVRPQLGQNIGKAARAMLNFGLTELRIVAPRDGWPNPEAGPAASGADVVLEQATIHDTVADAVANCTTVFASTVRRRDIILPVVGPADMASEIHAAHGRTAILFGPERSGLATEDVALAGKIVTVPINPEFGSLNLAQAVILLAYEWSRGRPLAQPTYRESEPPAPQSEVEGLVGQMDEALASSGYYFPAIRTEISRLNLRTMLTKPGWSSREIRAMRGMLRSIAKGSKR